MIFRVRNAVTSIENPSHIPQIRMILSFVIPSNIHMLRNLPHLKGKPFWLIKKIASKGQTVNLLDLRKLTFPTGLLDKVMDFCRKQGIPVSIRDMRIFTQGTGLNWYFTKTPRDYQIAPIQAAIKHKVGILNLATRSGKTVVAQCITAHFKLPTLFVVKSIELMEQGYKSWQQAFPLKRIGRIGNGRYDKQEITIVIIQSLLEEKELFADLYDYFKIVFFDELHNFGGQAFFKAAMRFNAPYRYGLSGTAFRNDEAGLCLNALCGEIIARVTTQELESKGVVYKTKIIMQKNPHPPMFPMSSHNWTKMYAWGVTSNIFRNQLILKWAWHLHNDHRTVLIIVKEIAHGNALKDMLSKTKAGIRVEFMNGKEPTPVRQKTLAEFCKGSIPFLIGTKIYNEGIDFVGIENPSIRGKSVILATAGRSKINAIQTTARPTTMEKKKGMAGEAIIIDFADTFHPLFRKHSLERFKTYKEIGGFSITVVNKVEDYPL